MTNNFLPLNSDKTEVVVVGPKRLRDTLKNILLSPTHIAKVRTVLSFHDAEKLIHAFAQPDLTPAILYNLNLTKEPPADSKCSPHSHTY